MTCNNFEQSTAASAGSQSVAGASGSGEEIPVETLLAEVLAGVLRTEQVPADGHFFTDLGADSLLMAHFCARVRKRDDLPTVSMKDVYRNPTIRGLAAALEPRAERPEEPPAGSGAGVPGAVPVAAGTARYVLCGALQLLAFLGMSFVAALALTRGYEWIRDGSGFAGVYLRSVLCAGAGFTGLCALPVAAKWILMGRFRPRRFPVWSLTYLRFWCVKALIRTSPMRLFAGTPLYVLYLRALGARVGRDSVVLSHHVPVCTDLLTVGQGTVIRKDALFSCYRARAGMIETGAVTLGRNVTVGEQAVLDIDTSMGDGARLAHASALHSGQAVPTGASWHGSPPSRAAPISGSSSRSRAAVCARPSTRPHNWRFCSGCTCRWRWAVSPCCPPPCRNWTWCRPPSTPSPVPRSTSTH